MRRVFLDNNLFLRNQKKKKPPKNRGFVRLLAILKLS